MSKVFYSQCGEDKWLYENYPELATRNGIFVEIGAYDGIESSNTLAFENSGWTGICFEPSPHTYAKLAKNRPNHSPLAIGPVEGLATFFDGGCDGFHSLRNSRNNNNHADIVQVARLENAVHYDHIDLLSIDTEGTELDVWESRGRLSPEFVICEFDTEGMPPISQKVIDQFVADGYELIHTTRYNHIFKKAKR